jgi:hypothetical protein
MDVVSSVTSDKTGVKLRLSDLTDEPTSYRTIELPYCTDRDTPDILLGSYNIELYRAYDVVPGPQFVKSIQAYEYRVRVQNTVLGRGITIHVRYIPEHNSFDHINSADDLTDDDSRIILYTTETTVTEMTHYAMCCLIGATPTPLSGGILHTITRNMTTFNNASPSSFLPDRLMQQYICGQKMAIYRSETDIWDITAAYPCALSYVCNEYPFLTPVAVLFYALYNYRRKSSSDCVKRISNMTTGMFLVASEYGIPPSVCAFFSDLYSVMVNTIRNVIIDITRDIPIIFCYVDSICADSLHRDIISARIRASPYSFKQTKITTLILVSPTVYIAQAADTSLIVKGADTQTKAGIHALALATNMFTTAIPSNYTLKGSLTSHRIIAQYHILFRLEKGSHYCFIFNQFALDRKDTTISSTFCPLCRIGVKS